MKELDGSSITRFHSFALSSSESSDPEDAGPTDAWFWIKANHHYNRRLWHEEDKARRTDVDPAEIAASKRLIDKYNQKRNDAIEAIDKAILTELSAVPHAADARLNSETAGAMIDRLSILSLKIFHMRLQTERDDVDADHIETCRAKLQRLFIQRRDLASCLDDLLAEAAAGRAYFKLYRQFKMYNDPALNPYLHGSGRGA
ncbi:DUF4254 domain-containing protein [Oxalobacteraceae bacterium CAVE-383]|nr:DUF4254 domain-containing protein [Oxalobacteraceae bacterium CAVE-383]